MALQHLRSSTANKRPLPGSMSDGQIAINTEATSPGLFFKNASGSLVKVGPVHVGTTAPNASPASGGETGNTVGEQWLDTTGGTYVFKVWDGSAWRSETGTFVDVNGDTMTGALGIIAGSAGSPGLFVSGDTNTGIYSPGADQLAVMTGGTERLRVGSGGAVGIGSTAVGGGAGGCSLRFANNLTGSTTPAGILGTPQVQSDATSATSVYSSLPSVVDSAFTCSDLRHYTAGQGTFGASATVTNQSGFFVGSTLTGATNNYGFNSNIASGTGRWNIYAGGTAANFFAGAVGIGSGTSVPGAALEVNAAASTASAIFKVNTSEAARIDDSGRLLVGTSATLSVPLSSSTLANCSYQQQGTLQQAASAFYSAYSTIATVAPNVVLGRSRGGLGSQGIVIADDSLGRLVFLGSDGQSVGTNAGFIRAAVIEAQVDGIPGASDMPGRIVLSTTADGGNSPTERWRVCEDGTVGYNQPAPVAVNTTATLTVANLKTGIITSTTAAAVTMTLPTGTLTEGGFSGLYNNFTFEWTVINTGATNAVTVSGGTAHTLVGSGTVAAGTSGRFASRRTAANTFVTYRLS